jgi:hypothetical protein
MRKPLLILLASLLAILVLAVLVPVMALDRSAERVWNQAIPEVNRLVQEAEPVPGSFSEAITALLPELVAWRRNEPELPPRVIEPCLDVQFGILPWEAVPPECAARLEHGRELLGRVLAATHSRSSGMPLVLTLTNSRRIKETDDVAAVLALREMPQLAALEIRRELSAGRSAEALSVCLDGLTLSREHALTATAEGSHDVWRIAGTLYRSCTAALAMLPDARRAEVLQQLRALRASLPPPSRSFRLEAVRDPFSTSGLLLSPEQLEQLAAPMRPIAQHPRWYPFAPDAWWLRPFVKENLARKFEYLQALAVAADLEPAAREAQFELLHEAFTRTWNPLDTVSKASFASYHARYAHELGAALDFLIAQVLVQEARERDGRWPESVPELSLGERAWLPTSFRLKVEVDDATRALLEPVDPALAELTLPLKAR